MVAYKALLPCLLFVKISLGATVDELESIGVISLISQTYILMNLFVGWLVGRCVPKTDAFSRGHIMAHNAFGNAG